jgi:hypothetical protein
LYFKSAVLATVSFLGGPGRVWEWRNGRLSSQLPPGEGRGQLNVQSAEFSIGQIFFMALLTICPDKRIIGFKIYS